MTALGLFVRFVRANPALDPDDPVMVRALRAYLASGGDEELDREAAKGAHPAGGELRHVGRLDELLDPERGAVRRLDDGTARL